MQGTVHRAVVDADRHESGGRTAPGPGHGHPALSEHTAGNAGRQSWWGAHWPRLAAVKPS